MAGRGLLLSLHAHRIGSGAIPHGLAQPADRPAQVAHVGQSLGISRHRAWFEAIAHIPVEGTLRGTFIPIHAADQDICTPQVDGVPVASFVKRLVKLMESAFWLND